MANLLRTDAGVRWTARALTWTAVAAGLAGAVVGGLPSTAYLATPLLVLATLLLAGGAFVIGWRPPERERQHELDEERFVRELVTNSWSLGLHLVFLVLLLVELLTIPAALGYLMFFGAFALSVVRFFPAVLFVVLLLVAAAFLHHVRAPGRGELSRARRAFAYVNLGTLAVFALLALLVQLGLGGLNPERSVFVLAGGFVALFFFVHTWTRMPSYDEVTRWMETEERLRHTNLLRNVVFVFLTVAGGGLVLALLSAPGLVPRPAGLVGLGLAMTAMIPATFSVGVTRFVAKLHEADADFAESRSRARVVLNSASIALTAIGAALGVATALAFVAQVGGVALFKALLDLFVAQYPVVLGLALVPVIVTVVLRTRFESEELYSDARKAITLFASIFTIVLAFFGIFIGSGMAEGTGIEIENAVLAMSAGMLALIALVKSRALLPGVVGMIRSSIRESAEADTDLKENIQKKMLMTYVSGLVFVVGFVGYVVATSLGVLPAPGSGIGTDAAFFGYLLVGLALLVLTVVRYFQGVNIDPRWKKKEEQVIGKKRVSAEELKRYIIIGASVSLATILVAVGVLVQLQLVTSFGPLTVEKKYATDFFVFGLLFGLGPYGFYHTREINRIAAIDSKFPEFLRDLAESQRAGMTLTEAVITAAKGNYGMLTPEIRKMASQIEWGVSFTEALERFAKRVRTPLISRTVSVITQAASAGGNVVDVLTAAANDSREIQMILKERKGAMAIYTMIIYVAFLVFMGVVAIMNAQFLPEVAKAVGKAEGVNLGGLKFQAIDEQAFRTVFFHAAIIQGLGGGIVAGVMEGGKPVTGLKHAFIMIVSAYVLFRFVIGG